MGYIRGIKTHGESHTRLHNIWCDMNKRCKHNPQYAGRGIAICDEWKDYEVFAEWARTNGYADNLTIERVDVDGNYCPENCKWIEFAKQARNRTTTKWVEYRGRTMSLAEAAELANLPYKTVHLRIKKGWSVERALSTPLKQLSDLHKMCNDRGLNYHSVYNRIRAGWSLGDALTKPFKIGNNQFTEM